MKHTEQRLTTPINKGHGIENLNYEEIKKMVRFNAGQEGINPRLVKNVGFSMSKHLYDCLQTAVTNSGKTKAHTLRTALYLFVSLEQKEQTELLSWFDKGYRKSK